jgi:hypothetical protein
MTILNAYSHCSYCTNLLLRTSATTTETVLVDRLGPAITANAQPLSAESVRALVPAVKDVQRTFEKARGTDDRFVSAMLSFDDSSKNVERYCMEEAEQLRKLIIASKACESIINMFDAANLMCTASLGTKAAAPPAVRYGSRSSGCALRSI